MTAFDELEEHYPEIIARMKKRFNSHKFILLLAHEYQGLYIQALTQYVDSPAPFQSVHRQLSQLLFKFDYLISHDGQEDSKDIFGHSNKASKWVRI